MHPNLFSVGPVTLHTYGLMIAVGVSFASWYLTTNAFRLGKTKDQMIDLILITTVSGFIGARLLYVIYEWNYFNENVWDILSIWKGGIIFYGGLLGGVLGFSVFTKLAKWPVLKTLDLLTPAAALAQGFGRIGCFLNGCCFGRETYSFLGVVFPFSKVPLHPTQLYDSFLGFLLFACLAFVYSKNHERPGRTSFLYFTLYSIGRFAIEFFRNDMARLAFGLTLGQWMSVGIFVAAVLAAFISKLKPHAH